ncbi:MAG TPA: glutathione S-transferase family protein [Saliniramus sp.]|nr:glutathione S-transferase family protein [Saliniramus sp.]
MPTLVIANTVYSSWSLRHLILMLHQCLDFEEIVITIDQPDTRQNILKYSPAGKVPILVDGDTRVWDSLAIMETLAERHPDLPIWPEDPAARAMARSIAAEMHSGFGALRKAMPMNIAERFAHRERGAEVEADVERVTTIWREARSRFGAGGPFLFGAEFGAADAMYAPVVTRFDTYSWPVDPTSRAYMDAVLALPAYREWLEGALAEGWIIDYDIDEEPIAQLRDMNA